MSLVAEIPPLSYRPITLSSLRFLGAVALALVLAWTLQWQQAQLVLQSGSFGDTDDAMRMVQVRDLLAGQGWFDLQQYRVMAPDGIWMHWSRLIDAPIAFLVILLGWFFDPILAERLARLIMSGSVQCAFFVAVIASASRLGGERAIWPAAILSGTCLAAAFQFAPGRIDHHDVQIVLALALATFVIAARDNDKDAMVSGALGAMMMAIGLETLHLIAVTCAIFVMRWVVVGKAAQSMMRLFGLSFAVSTFVFFLLGVQPAHWSHPTCDAIGLPILGFAAMAGFAMLLCSYASPWLRRPGQRFGAALAIGALSLATLALVFPECRLGPLGAIPTDVKAFWLDHVAETRSLATLLKEEPGIFVAVFGCALSGTAALAALWVIDKLQKDAWLTLVSMIVASFVITAFQIRGLGILIALTLPGAALLIAHLWAKRPSLGALALAATSSMGWVIISLTLFAPAASSVGSACLAPSSFSDLAKLPSGLVATSTDLGAHILAYTPHTVLGAPYHRNIIGLRLSHSLFTQSPDEIAPMLTKLGARYVAICRDLPEMRAVLDTTPKGLGALLLKGEVPSWLTFLKQTGPMSVWQIDPVN